MENGLYNRIKAYLISGDEPDDVSSTKSNFYALANKHEINKKGNLIRNNKIVVTISMQENIFNEMHAHSGRSACWQRIKER